MEYLAVAASDRFGFFSASRRNNSNGHNRLFTFDVWNAMGEKQTSLLDCTPTSMRFKSDNGYIIGGCETEMKILVIDHTITYHNGGQSQISTTQRNMNVRDVATSPFDTDSFYFYLDTVNKVRKLDFA